MKTLIVALILTATTANAKNVPAIFTVNGKIVSASEALAAAMDSKEVLKCQTVLLTPSKSGTSFSLKAKKLAE